MVGVGRASGQQGQIPDLLVNPASNSKAPPETARRRAERICKAGRHSRPTLLCKDYPWLRIKPADRLAHLRALCILYTHIFWKTAKFQKTFKKGLRPMDFSPFYYSKRALQMKIRNKLFKKEGILIFRVPFCSSISSSATGFLGVRQRAVYGNGAACLSRKNKEGSFLKNSL